MKKLFKSINKRKLIITGFFVIVLVFSYCVLNYNKLVAVYNLEKNVEQKLHRGSSYNSNVTNNDDKKCDSNPNDEYIFRNEKKKVAFKVDKKRG